MIVTNQSYWLHKFGLIIFGEYVIWISFFCQVRMAAFQQLGPFISTFADPGLTGLYVNEDGILSVQMEHIQNM